MARKAGAAGYTAFISYHRGSDAEFARAFESSIERFATPWYRLRAFNVFRDDSELSATNDLWSPIQTALDEANWFILLASPGAAASQGVAQELRRWLEGHDPDHLLGVHTGGEFKWDRERGEPDWSATTAIPPVLSGVLTAEPRWPDARGAELTLSHPRFEEAVASVVARIRGIDKERLISQHVKQHRRMLATAWGTAAALACLLVIAVAAALVASHERNVAEARARTATSRQLAAESLVAAGDSKLDRALVLAAQAWRTDPTAEARDALLAALNASPLLETTLHGGPSDVAVFSGDRRRIALRSQDGVVRTWDLSALRPTGRAIEVGDSRGLALDGTGRRLAAGYEDGHVRLWSVASGQAREIAPPAEGDESPYASAVNLSFATRGDRLVWQGPDTGVSLWNGRRTVHLDADASAGDAPWQPVLSPDGRRLAAVAGSSLVLWRLTAAGAPREPRIVDIPTSKDVVLGVTVGAVAFSPRSPSQLALGQLDGTITLWDADKGKPIGALAPHTTRIDELAYSPGGERVAVLDQTGLSVYTAAGRRVAGPYPATNAALGGAPLDERGRFATAGRAGTIFIRDTRSPAHQLVRALDDPRRTFRDLAFTADGSRLVALGTDGRLRGWSIATGGSTGPATTTRVDDTELAPLPGGRMLSCCGGTAGIREWNLARPAVPPRTIARAAGTPVSIGVTSDGGVVTLSGGDEEGEPIVWRSGGGRKRLAGTDGGYQPELSPDGSWVAIETDDRAVWSTATGKQTIRLPTDSVRIAFSRDGSVLASVSLDGPISLLDPASGKLRARLDQDQPAGALAFSPGDGLLAALSSRVDYVDASTPERLDLWDTTRRRRIGGEALLDDAQIGAAGTEESHALRLDPQARTLLITTTKGDVTARERDPLLIDLDVGHWAALACRLANRTLTTDEWAPISKVAGRRACA